MRRARIALALALACAALTACSYDRDAAGGDDDDGDSVTSDGATVDSPAIDVDALDAAIDAVDAPVSCVGETRCTGDVAQQCNGQNVWVDLPACTNFCGAGGCVNPPSCSSIGNCAGQSCCAARLVPAGTYYRSYDGVTYLNMTYPATVSGFVLDRFEVSVNRFRRFVAAYPGSLPIAGAGKNPHNPADPGWDSAWNVSLPGDKAALENALTGCAGTTYTVAAGANDDKPANCVSWQLALAFCIWDGGRLPTEAEWNRAAAGGDEQRVYPWSNPATSTTIDATRAVYATTATAPVGSRPQGDGRWTHADLAGNVQEWVADWYRDPLASNSCTDCQDVTASTARVLRGGQFMSSSGAVTVGLRNSTTPLTLRNTIGFRCVHDR